jgi:GNAT superfamily N-acetyltransferase
MRETLGEYELDDDLARMDLPRVHAWLSGSYWWSRGITLEKAQRAARGSSLVVGAFATVDGTQVGYLRVVSDRATFAWIADVFVDEAHRKRGIARSMIQFCLKHPQHRGLRRWVLATRDAHEVYRPLGFIPLPEPQRWMIYYPPDGGDVSAAPGPGEIDGIDG